jgi:ABC-2 type transport system ATP-binding protein
MAQIIVENLVKTFNVSERAAGMWGAVRGVVRRRHRTVRALDGVSFALDAGELIGYIGPNGAGKSTTVKTLAGILVPDSGRCEVLGRIPWRDRIAHVAAIGVVFGQRTQLWWDLPVTESFELLRDIYRVSRGDYAAALDELVALLDLEPLLDVPVRQLSLGQRMRCDLAAALLHAPSILFLDEPTIGLDAISKLAVRDFIKRLNQERGVTVILTTHDMDDIEALCTRVIVIGDGRVLSDGTLSALRDQVTRERWLTVDLVQAGDSISDPDATVIRQDGHRVCLAFDPQRISSAELIQRITSAHAIRDLFVENPPIETIIARLYGNQAGPLRGPRPTPTSLSRHDEPPT